MTVESKPEKDLRRAERVRTLLGARVLFNDGRLVMDCQIRNLSETGARLSLSDALILPKTFDLEIPSQSKMHHVILRWRQADAAGVEFDIPVRHVSRAQDDQDELVQLRQENIQLRQRLSEMTKRLSELGFSSVHI